MNLDVLAGELERLFSVEDLASISRDVLALDPDTLGPAVAAATFARSVADRCAEVDAVDALVDAVLALRADADRDLRGRIWGRKVEEALAPGAAIGSFTIVHKLGESSSGITYHAREGERDVALKILHSEAARDRRTLQRFLTTLRLSARVEQEGLPRGLRAGTLANGLFVYAAYDLSDGESLLARLDRTGPMRFDDARPLLRVIVGALAGLHKSRIAHGNVKLENIIVARGTKTPTTATLVDAGGDRLRLWPRWRNGSSDLIAVIGSARTVAPEQVKGGAADARTDVYALGAVMYHLLTGRPVFVGATPFDVALMHLHAEPEPLTLVGPRGLISPDVDAFVLSLLTKDPSRRPSDMNALLEGFSSLGRAARTPSEPSVASVSGEELARRIEALLAAPDDEDRARKVEDAADEGAAFGKVADALVLAADQFVSTEGSRQRDVRQGLLYRAARVYENGQDLASAEGAYRRLRELDEGDEVAATALQQVQMALGKYDEVIEALLAQSEAVDSGAGRARILAEIGRLYAEELDEKPQAVVAYAHAFCVDPQVRRYAEEVERIAGEDAELYAEAVAMCGNAASTSLDVDAKNRILERLGAWYADKVAQPSLALSCFLAILATDPANEAALEGATHVYRKAQEWSELAKMLLLRADGAKTPARARELRLDAAEIFAARLDDEPRAREIYEAVVAQDPTHPRALLGLRQMLEQAGDFAALAKLLEQIAESLRGEEKRAALAVLAALYEDRLDDKAEAARRYQAILAIDENDLVALQGLDRAYSHAGKYRDLLGVLERQLVVAATPRQQVLVLTRIAALNEEEFLDHEKASQACERILAIDPAREVTLVALARHYRALERWEDLVNLLLRHANLTTDDARRIELDMAQAKVLAEKVKSPERAIRAFEAVLAIDETHGPALEALARLREISGNTAEAVAAMETLALQGATAEAKAEHWMRAARLLESAGDGDGAIERMKRALEASPTALAIATTLRLAYVKRGDASAAIEMLRREGEGTRDSLERARLFATMATLWRDKLKDNERAELAALQAHEIDPANLEAIALLGDIAFDAKDMVEATARYESLVARIEELPQDTVPGVLRRYVEGLSRTSGSKKALGVIDDLLRSASDDEKALSLAASVTFEHGEPQRALALYRELLSRFRDKMTRGEEAVALYRSGEAARQSGDLDAAVLALREAVDLDPSLAAALSALASVYEARQDWEEVIRLKTRRLDIATGDERSLLLLEVGDIYSGRLFDRVSATKSYLGALEDCPDDRNALAKLMQLYSDDRDWSKLVDVVLRLAAFIDDKKQKAKYIHTAAVVTAKNLGNTSQALAYLEQVLELDPNLERALDDAVALYQQQGDHASAERLLKIKLLRANEANDQAKMLESFGALAEVYHRGLGWIREAIDAYEAAQTLDPENKERNEILAELYIADPDQYLDKAVESLRAVLRKTPHLAEPYRQLRRLYTATKRGDAAWCLCQALCVMKLAEPDEERFFERLRSGEVAPAHERLGNGDWMRLLGHEDRDPLVTAIFGLIEPVVIAMRAPPLHELGYGSEFSLDLETHPAPMAKTLLYAAETLGMGVPPTFLNANDPGGVSFLHAHPPSIVLGLAALQMNLPGQAGAFIAGRHLAFYRSGMYLRQLVPTVTGLKAWLFGAIKLISPQFPVPPELEGPVSENLAALDRAIVDSNRDLLASLVSKLLQSGGALDFKRWVAAVDLTADRAGFLLADDLEVAHELIRASAEDSASVSNGERLKELVLFSMSDEYFALRRRLQIAIES